MHSQICKFYVPLSFDMQNAGSSSDLEFLFEAIP
jgi:hypothetical protein